MLVLELTIHNLNYMLTVIYVVVGLVHLMAGVLMQLTVLLVFTWVQPAMLMVIYKSFLVIQRVDGLILLIILEPTQPTLREELDMELVERMLV